MAAAAPPPSARHIDASAPAFPVPTVAAGSAAARCSPRSAEEGEPGVSGGVGGDVLPRAGPARPQAAKRALGRALSGFNPAVGAEETARPGAEDGDPLH